MNQDILLTKLQPPLLAHDILPRARLLDRLNEGRQRILTLISAPAGYGKSTLASSWIRACDCPSGWISLDKRESDLRTFLTYVIAAIRSLFPEIELRTEILLEAQRPPSPPVSAQFLLNDLQQVTDPFILVLDDFQLTHGSSVQDFVTAFLAHPSRKVHLVLLTRRDPAIPLATLRARGQLTEIRSADLRFTPTETAAFINQKLKVPLDDASAELLEKKTEGWVTGLRLAGFYLRGQDDPKRRVQELRGSSRYIAEYLGAEVLSRQKPEILAYLLETSILDRFCTPLCQAVHLSGVDGPDKEQNFDAQRFMDWLIEANLFIISLDEQGYWYRYHHLFQEFLQSWLRKQYHTDTIVNLHKLAGNWFAENNLIEEAIQHMLAGNDTQIAVQLVIDHRYEMMNSSQFIRLARLMALLPKNAASEKPLLVIARAFIGVEMGQDEVLFSCTEQTERMLGRVSADSAEHPILKAELLILQGFIDMAIGDPDSGIARTQEAMASLPARALLIRSLGILTLAICLQMNGNPELSIKMVQDVLSNTDWPTNIRSRIHFYLSIALYMHGDLTGAMSSSRDCLQIVRSLSFTHTETFAYYLLGAANYWRNELETAESQVLRVLDDYHAANPSYVANAGFVLVCIYLARNRKEEAERILDSIGAHFQEIGNTMALGFTKAFQVECALRQKDFEKASQLNKYIEFDMRPPIWFFYVPQLTPIKLLLAEGTDQSLKNAYTRIATLDEKMRKIKRNSVRIDVLALYALVCHKLGDESTALEKLQTALVLAEPGGWIRNFVDLGTPMRDLLERLDQVQPGHLYTQQVLAAFKADTRRSSASDSDAKKGSRLPGQFPVKLLTPRETELLLLIASGMSNKQIAADLHIATETVKAHLKNIYRKLDAKGRIGAITGARRLGLIPYE